MAITFMKKQDEAFPKKVETKGFNLFIDTLGILDFNMHSASFTWSNTTDSRDEFRLS